MRIANEGVTPVRAAGHAYRLLQTTQIDLIHRGALRILSEMGMQVENRRLLRLLAGAGASVDLDGERVRFPAPYVERFIADADKHNWEHATPRVSGSAGVYHSLYHDPESGKLVPWTERALEAYFYLARCLPHVDGATMLGCRLSVPPVLEPLYERYYCWKYGAREAGSIHLDRLCPYILDLYQALADERDVPLAKAFSGTVYLVPPLKLARHEAYQIAYYAERGLRVRVGGGMPTMGATAPVTLAGAVTLNLAEQLALCMLDAALWGEKRLHLGSSISVLDMRTTIRPFGRPEMTLANLMTAQLARYYGASFSGHAGLSDAKLPSVEAGAQKVMSAAPTLLAGGSLWVDAGLLASDEVCSPVQMVLDDEWMGALARFTHQFEISETTIGLETILGAGPGGQFLDKQHTVDHFRQEHWNPSIWSRQMLRPWLQGDQSLDADRAREKALRVEDEMQRSSPAFMSASLERAVLAIIERARNDLVR
jgi:trimethylamine--corrinoid protein Co-methyltransferase